MILYEKIRRWIYITVPLLVLAFAGYGLFKTWRADQQVEKLTRETDAELSDYGVSLAKRFGLMSLFAEAVYRRSSDRSSSDTISNCGGPDSKDYDYLMPWAEDEQGNRYTWSRLLKPEGGEAEPCYSDGGLYYETYILQDASGKVLEAVIAYRGTDGFKDDMTTNVAAAFGIEPPQYAAAKAKLIPLVDYLNASYSAPKIYAVGHSLGGGLAQQAGYLSKSIKEVFTFNTTPVTNWSNLVLSENEEIKNRYPIIYRINHGGEALSPLRTVTSAFNSARYNRYDIGVQITEKSLMDGHGIALIACSFAQAIHQLPKQNLKADHYYGVEYIGENIATSNGEYEENQMLHCKPKD